MNRRRHLMTAILLVLVSLGLNLPGEPTITRLPGGSSARFAAVAKPQLDALLGLRTVLPGHHDPVHAAGSALIQD